MCVMKLKWLKITNLVHESGRKDTSKERAHKHFVVMCAKKTILNVTHAKITLFRHFRHACGNVTMLLNTLN